MTYRDYFNAHPEENLSWCKTMTTRDGNVMITMTEGEIADILVDDCEIPKTRRLGLTKRFSDDQLKAVARLVDEYAEERMEGGWSAKELICSAETLHEIGCCHCPYFDECEAMDAEIDEEDF